MEWNQRMADEVDRLLSGKLKDHPMIARHGSEGDNRVIVEELRDETRKWRKNQKWALDSFFRGFGRADLHIAGLMAFKSIMESDDKPKSKPKLGKLEKPKIHVGDHEIDGDLDLDEAGPLLVTGSLRVSGAIFGRGAQGPELTPGKPLFVAGDVRCQAMNLAWHTVIGGNLDAGDLLICERKATFLVSGTIRARVVLGREMEWELWNARHPIEAEFVELSRYNPKLGKAFDRTAAWWSALGEVLKPKLLAKSLNLWTVYRKSPKIFNGPPNMRRWIDETRRGSMLPSPLTFSPEPPQPNLPG